MWLPVVISLCALLISLKGSRRQDRQDVTQDAISGAELKSELNYISRGVDDMRVEMRAMRNEVGDLAERVTRVEESAKQAHKRIDGLGPRREVNMHPPD